MRLISARSVGLVVLSAILQITVFPIAGDVPVWRTSIGFMALVPLLLAIVRLPKGEGNAGYIAAGLFGYTSGVIWYAGNCAWIYQTMYIYGGLSKPLAFAILVLFSLYLGLYHAAFALLLHSFASRLASPGAALAMSPFLWVGIEFARARITGFPWDLLGYSQIDNLLLTRLAPLGGVMLMSFIIAAVNALFTLAILVPGRQRRVSLSAAVASIVVLLAASFLYHPKVDATQMQSAILLQQNLAVGALGRQQPPLSLAQEITDFTSLTVEAWQPAQAPAVVVWPEAPSHFQSSDPAFRDAMTSLARKLQAPLIIGSLGVDFDARSARGYFLYDSASLFDSAGVYKGRYNKMHLVPWGEYIPFKQLFAFAQKLTEGAGDMDRGVHRTVFTTGGHTYGVFICYESIFGDEVRKFVSAGAEVLVNISDDGWYGDTGAPWQHLNMARMRAIENDRWLLRDTNTGITTVIDPLGRTLRPAQRHIRGAFVFPFAYKPAASLTLYTRFGDWFAWLCVLVTAIGAFVVGRRRII